IDASIGGPASGRQSSDYLHFIVVFRPEREPVLPDVLTMKEQGFDVPYISQVWYTYAAPKTPADRLDQLQAALPQALATPARRRRRSRRNRAPASLASARSVAPSCATSGRRATSSPTLTRPSCWQTANTIAPGRHRHVGLPHLSPGEAPAGGSHAAGG